jgi:hypothetical protein
MAAYLPLFFDQQFMANSGSLGALYNLHTYDNGTTTPKATYTDATGNVANANPIPLNSAGRPPSAVFLGAGSYSFELKDSDGALVKRWDAVTSANTQIIDLSSNLASRSNASLGGGMVGHSPLLNYVAGTIGYAVNARGLTVADFKIDASGNARTDQEAFADAAAYAHTLIGTAAYNDRGCDIQFPAGIWDLTGISTIAITKSGIGVIGLGAPRAAVLRCDGPLFDVGDYTHAIRVRGVTFANLTFFNTDYANTDACVKLYRTAGTRFDSVQFINWYIDIDAYRASTTVLEMVNSDRPNRTVAGLAMLRAQGLDETTFAVPSTYSPGGGFHIGSGCEFNGASATVDTTYCFLLKSVDGFYTSSDVHCTGYEKTIALAPDATPENRVVVDVNIDSIYVDEPSAFAGSPICVSIEGAVKRTITMASGGTQSSIYRGIRLNGGLLRGADAAKYGVLVRVGDTDGDYYNYTAREFGDISITGVTMRQAATRAIQVTGAGSGAYVEPANLLITGCTFSENNSDGGTGASDISVAAENVMITNNTFAAAAATGADYVIDVVASDAGATDDANPCAIVAGNNLAKCGPVADKYIRITTPDDGANTIEEGNLLPGMGKRIDQTYAATTVGATSKDIWSYVVPEGTGGNVQVFLQGTTEDGSKHVSYSWSAGFRRNAGGTTLSTGTTNFTPGTAWDPDTITTPPTATRATNTLKVTVTGEAAETYYWTARIAADFSR